MLGIIFICNLKAEGYSIGSVMQIGFISLGKMGSRMAGKLIEEEHDVVAWTRSESTISNFKFPVLVNGHYGLDPLQVGKFWQKSFTAKMAATIRNAFGGHEVKKSK